MSQSEARAWWAEVQDVRETIERRRAAEHGHAAEREHVRERSHLRAVEAAPVEPIWGEPVQPVQPVAPARRRSGGRNAQAKDRTPLFDQEAFAESRSRGGSRRTVEITGRTVGAPALPRLVEINRRRPAPRAIDRVGGRPDRLAMWAVLLGIVLVLAALSSSSHAATPHQFAHAAAAHVASR